MDLSFLLVALVYAGIFWAVSWRTPGVALALIFATAPFQNDLSGGGGAHFSFAEINLVLALPLFVVMLLLGARKMRIWPLFWASALYTLACVMSALTEWRPTSAPTSFIQMGLFLFVVVPIFALMGRRPSDLKPALWGMLGIAAIIAVQKMLHPGAEAFGINKNGMGGSMACALIVATELWFHYDKKPGRYKAILVALMGIISVGLLLTLSRGGMLAATAGIVLIVALRRQFVLLGRIALVLVPVGVLVWSVLPQDSREYATSFSSERGNIKQRYINTDNTLKEWQKNIWFGAGMGLRKDLDATNLVVMALGETGIVGLITFLGIFVSYFVSLWNARERLPRDEFAFSLLCIGGGLMLSRFTQGMVDHYWARGPTMMAWAGAGMATGALWYRPENAKLTLTRARALLSLHLLEAMRRKDHSNTPLPTLTRAELEAAQEALMHVKTALQSASPAQAGEMREELRPLLERLQGGGE